jgi:hypothetical protein
MHFGDNVDLKPSRRGRISESALRSVGHKLQFSKSDCGISIFEGQIVVDISSSEPRSLKLVIESPHRE